MFQRIKLTLSFGEIKFVFCTNQDCVFLKSSLRFSEIKFAFYRNQVYVSKNQVSFEFIESRLRFRESSLRAKSQVAVTPYNRY